MRSIFIYQIVQITLSILVILLVLIQAKGTGLYSAFGNTIGFYRSRRGIEKFVFVLTIVLITLIALNSIVIVLLS